MGSLTLHPDRITVRWYSEEETLRPAGIQELSPYFFYTLSLDPDFTLGDLFALVDQEDVALLEMVLGEQVGPVLEEARRAALFLMPPSEPESSSHPDPWQPDFLRVCNVHAEGSLRRDFDGWGPWAEPYEGAWEEHPDWPRVGPIGVSLTPVTRLLHLPLRYDPELIFRDPDDTEEYRTTVDITLIDFLKTVFFELTFHGTPQERDEVWRELQRRMDDMESGRVRSIPAEEVFRGLREEEAGEGMEDGDDV